MLCSNISCLSGPLKRHICIPAYKVCRNNALAPVTSYAAPHKRLDRKRLSVVSAIMTTAEQERVVTELRQLRYGRKPSLNSIARAAGISRTMLYNVINSGQASVAVAAALQRGLQAVQKNRY